MQRISLVLGLVGVVVLAAAAEAGPIRDRLNRRRAAPVNYGTTATVVESQPAASETPTASAPMTQTTPTVAAPMTQTVVRRTGLFGRRRVVETVPVSTASPPATTERIGPPKDLTPTTPPATTAEGTAPTTPGDSRATDTRSYYSGPTAGTPMNTSMPSSGRFAGRRAERPQSGRLLLLRRNR